VRVLAVGVQKLHPAHLGADRTELLARAEGLVDHVAVGGAPQLGAHERGALARVHVLELEHLEHVPSTSMWLPFLSWLVEIIACKCSRRAGPGPGRVGPTRSPGRPIAVSWRHGDTPPEAGTRTRRSPRQSSPPRCASSPLRPRTRRCGSAGVTPPRRPPPSCSSPPGARCSSAAAPPPTATDAPPRTRPPPTRPVRFTDPAPVDHARDPEQPAVIAPSRRVRPTRASGAGTAAGRERAAADTRVARPRARARHRVAPVRRRVTSRPCRAHAPLPRHWSRTGRGSRPRCPTPRRSGRARAGGPVSAPPSPRRSSSRSS